MVAYDSYLPAEPRAALTSSRRPSRPYLSSVCTSPSELLQHLLSVLLEIVSYLSTSEV